MPLYLLPGGTLHKLNIRRFAIVFGSLAVLGTSATLAAGAAGASTGLTVTLSNSPNDGASATCSSSGIVLTTGSDVLTTFAQADVNGVDGTALSATAAPSFVTDNYNSGSPRWVIELSNGESLWGYPPNAGLNGTDFAWAVDNGNTYTSYGTAYTAADAGGTGVTITDAFIVEDGDQPSTTDTITEATFNGVPLTCAAAPAPTPSTSASPSASGKGSTPTGGVETGGGKPVSDPLVPIGVGIAAIAVLGLGVGAIRRRQHQG
jgi:hypothetical protein